MTVFAVLLVLTGLMLLIVPKISNRVGEQIAHSAIEDFKALKSQATADELTDRKEADEDSTADNDSQKDDSSVVQSDNESVILDNDEWRSLGDTTSDSSDTDFDPYATENRYDIDDEMFEKRDGVDYGTVQKDVSYYSTTAGDNKQCNILLPAGYNENEKYPVMYVFHGFGGSHSDQIDDDSYLTLLYGNMLHDDLTVPMIIVNVDMYTDKQAD